MSAGRPRRILFATSNGTGLGHLNRSMAIARRLPEEHESRFFTLSQAAPAVAAAGHRVEYFPSYRRPGSGSDQQWNMRLRRRLEQLLSEAEPDLVVFDGVHPYRALTHVLTRADAPRSIWSRRAMWRAESATAALARTGAFDAVLEPGELAESVDRGATVERRDEAVRVAPVIYLDREELTSRDKAAAELGLDPSRATALVSLGQGPELDQAVAAALGSLSADPDLQLVALQSSISDALEVPEGTIRLQGRFPISRLYRAFDLVVAAAGYNAFHELIHFGVPTLFVPMHRQTDDQAARASWASEQGVALAAKGPLDPEIPGLAAQLLEPSTRERITAAALAASPGNGAGAAAALVAAMAGGESPAPAVRRPGAFHRWYRHSSHPLGPSLPFAAALTARDLSAHPERRSPKAVLLALGLTGDELRAAVLAGLGELDAIVPERVLVITDSWELATLRGLGVGFERIPGLGEGGNTDAARLQASRVTEIMRGRRPREVRSIGPDGAQLLPLINGERS